MRYLPMVSVIHTVDGGQHAPSLEKQAGILTLKLNIVLLWMRSAAKCILTS